MTRFIYDQFSKDYLETLLSPHGKVEIAKQVAGEIREIDVWFVPNSLDLPEHLGTLGKLAATISLFEPYRNPATANEIRDCLLKLLEIKRQLQREANRDKSRLSEAQLPKLWILTPTASEKIIEGFGGKLKSDWGEGIYFLADLLRTAIVVIHQLPQTRETLWLRLLGRGKVQQQAIDELEIMADDHPLKLAILEVLYSLQKHLQINQDNQKQEDRELIMRLTPLYREERRKAIQEGFEQGRAEGRAEGEVSLILRLLKRKFGNISAAVEEKIRSLNLEQLENLGEALLDFNQEEDLTNWLNANLGNI